MIEALLPAGTRARRWWFPGLKAFKFQENWMNFRRVAEALKHEEYYYEAEAGPYLSSSDRRQHFC
jgi:hypothetical protein